MKIINPEAFIKAYECTEKGEFGELSAEHFEIPYTDVKPIEGYEPEPNFPLCDNFHKSLFDYVVSWFEKFPHCCPGHRRLLNAEWFKKENYETMPNKVLTQLSFTEYHISKQINNDDWFEDITDYIEYNFKSFGQLPLGYGTPVGVTPYGNVLIAFLNNTKEEIVSKDKQQKLIEYLESFYNQKSTHNENPKTDLNILLGIYQKWLKIFPFEISYLAHLKPYFESQLPLIQGKPILNRYSGIAKAQLHTKGSLIDFLLNATNHILTIINSHSLYKQGFLTEPQKIKLELVLNEREMKLKQGYINNSTDEELRYRRILKAWFADEKRFIDEITPLLKTLPQQQAEPKGEQRQPEIKPNLKPEAVHPLFDILKDFFSPEQQPILKQILQTGTNASEKLLFKGNGNRLADTFKKLIEVDYITGCQKQDLERWIVSNFTYMHNNKVKKFLPDTVEKTISRNDNPCKSPIVEIFNGQIHKVEQPRSKNYNK